MWCLFRRFNQVPNKYHSFVPKMHSWVRYMINYLESWTIFCASFQCCFPQTFVPSPSAPPSSFVSKNRGRKSESLFRHTAANFSGWAHKQTLESAENPKSSSEYTESMDSSTEIWSELTETAREAAANSTKTTDELMKSWNKSTEGSEVSHESRKFREVNRKFEQVWTKISEKKG